LKTYLNLQLSNKIGESILTKHLTALKTFLAVLIVGALLVAPVFASQDSAQTAISQAKVSLRTCYEAVSRAESAGANVSSLMVTLNGAADLLSKAELAYASNSYDAAYTYATQSQSTLGDFETQANTLTLDAQANAQQNTIFVYVSGIAGLGILGAGIVAWVVLGRAKRRNLLGASTV